MSDYGKACGSYGYKYRSESQRLIGVETPAPPWTQYRCTHCGFLNRIRVSPSHSPRRLPSEHCVRCDGKTPHISDGGSGVL